MRHVRLFRAMLGGAGLAGCVGLLAGQARADIVEFVPVRPGGPPVSVTANAPPAAPAIAVAATPPATAHAHAAAGPAGTKPAGCPAERLAMAPVRGRAAD